MAVPRQSLKRRKSNRDVNIQAHEDTNSLVITAQPDVMRSLESVIRQLDFRRAQINVEAIIVEVSEGDGIDLGVQWASADGGVIQFNNGGAHLVSGIAAGVASSTEISVVKLAKSDRQLLVLTGRLQGLTIKHTM